MSNDTRDESSKTGVPTEGRRRYEAPRLEKKRSVARVTLASSGQAQTTTTTIFPQ